MDVRPEWPTMNGLVSSFNRLIANPKPLCYLHVVNIIENSFNQYCPALLLTILPQQWCLILFKTTKYYESNKVSR